MQKPSDQILAASTRDTVIDLAIMVITDPGVSFLKRGRVEGWLPY